MRKLTLPFRSRASEPAAGAQPGSTPAGSPERDAVSIRGLRVRAAAPRLALYLLVAVLCLAGFRAIVEPAPAAPPPPPIADDGGDLAAQGFAEAFARAYLTWNDEGIEAREQRMAPFLPESADRSAGFRPGDGTAQDVFWTAVAGIRRVDDRVLVTVVAETSGGLLHLAVPVARDPEGLLYVSGNPAFVGPPASASEPDIPSEEQVEDSSLVTVVERALENYLARQGENLRADLAPGSVVSLPSRPLRVVERRAVTWLERDRRVAVEVTAEDARKSSWALRYELDVEKRDRWYVLSLEVDPTFEEVPG